MIMCKYKLALFNLINFGFATFSVSASFLDASLHVQDRAIFVFKRIYIYTISVQCK